MRTPTIFIILTAMILTAAPARAATINLNPGDSIQTAINSASGGDEIVLAAGTYIEAIDFLGKAVTVRSASGDPADTIIDGVGALHVVQCVSGEGAGTVLEGVTITGGNANGSSPDDRGGGMYNFSSSPMVTNCSFIGNTAGWGGGMYISGSPVVTDCTFSGNTAALSGGMHVRGSSSSPTVTNCTFSGNTAEGGGGMGIRSSASPLVTNCTFSGNTADNGGGIYNSSFGPVVTNCIFWGDSPNEIYNFDGFGSILVTFSNVYGGFAGSGNIAIDPLFADADGADNIIGTADDDLRLCQFSPCIDAGDNAAMLGGVTTDLDANPRFVDDAAVVDTGNGAAPVLDMGAYEQQTASVLEVNLVPGDSIQIAIDLACDGVEIVLAPGTYFGSIDFLGKAITVRGASGDPADTIIDGNGAVHVVQCVSNEGAGTVLEGVTIAGGNANGSFPDDRGGGMYNIGSSPTVTNCTFSGNLAALYGGGMFNDVGACPTVTNCSFSENMVVGVIFNDALGGGMYNGGSNATVTGCLFSGNSAQGPGAKGGGLYNTSSNPTVTDCTFVGNSSEDGGGMCNILSSPTVINCTFSGNTAIFGGGMFNFTGTNPTVTNCTFSGNVASWCGGGMFIYSGSSPTVTNCTLWGDSPEEIGFCLGTGANPAFTYCNIEGGFAGIGNIDADPLFADADGADNIVGTPDDDLRLTAGSPCIDAGDDTAVPVGVTTDADGNDRFMDGDGNGDATVDMGAYELPTLPCVGDTDGNGAVDVDDLVSVILDWGSDGSANGGDVNGSGVVDVDDLVAVILAWGLCP